ncbi:MAG TPA: endonuclease/exonuclease/phosphatase family protein [Candidatus Dormibacteraeota bacterium]|jgi:endonuclease/exonuclease/phosphatase family metal-dependent hydrolase|nr:endonuclease/exonuclease/phosphatase family protein [Candidatus Dormibacteraeota bacterium]
MLAPVRICTWNIQMGLRLGEVVDAVESHPDFAKVDLLALQESSIHDGRPDAEVIAEALGPEFRCFQATAQMLRGRDQGNALIWRPEAFQPDAPEVVALTGAGVVRMTRAEQTLLRAIPPQRRIALRAESAAMRVYVVHLDVVGFTHKLEQFGAVVADMQARPEVPLTLVAGDLNTFGMPRLQMWRRIRASAKTAELVELTRTVRRTHWTSQKLDAIYMKGAAASEHHAWALAIRGSDHLPVFADIEAHGVSRA